MRGTVASSVAWPPSKHRGLDREGACAVDKTGEELRLTNASSNSGSRAEGSNREEIEVTHPNHRTSIVSTGGVDAVLVALAVAVDALASRKRGNREHEIARHRCAILTSLPTN